MLSPLPSGYVLIGDGNRMNIYEVGGSSILLLFILLVAFRILLPPQFEQAYVLIGNAESARHSDGSSNLGSNNVSPDSRLCFNRKLKMHIILLMGTYYHHFCDHNEQGAKSFQQ
jgi:hypothetical protein